MINSPIEEIKNRLDIVEVISSYIKLQKAGANYRALCPFHSEKRPSFFVSPSRQIWHCFGGCSEGGDIFKFVMKIEGIEFGDALRILAQKAGVELKKENPKLRTERQRLYEICELAAKFFEKQLEESKTGKEAKKYLLRRGISEDSLRKWRLGYAPDVWKSLSDFLASAGYKKEEVEKAGLGLTSEKGSFYDRFRGRIIFPIFDLNSQVIGFGGRIFKEKDKSEIAKYVNTPNTILYDKSRVLYGLDKAKMEIRQKNECILVEGYTDVIMLSQAGYQNVVATSGIALTPYQLKILKRYSENIFTAFDMDIAGDSATKRGIDLAQAEGFNIKVIVMPKETDPADIISKNLKEWEKLVKGAKSILDFYFQSTLSRFDSKTIEGKKEISKILLPIIKRIPNKIEQAFWIQELAKRIEVKENAIEEELKKVKKEPLTYFGPAIQESEKKQDLAKESKSRKELLEERLLSLILKSPENLNLITKEYLEFFCPKISQIITQLKKGGSEKELESELKDFLNYISLKSEVEIKESSPLPVFFHLLVGECQPEEISKEIQKCLEEIKNIEIRNKLDKISFDIKKAEKEKDLAKTKKLLDEFHRHSQLLSN